MLQYGGRKVRIAPTVLLSATDQEAIHTQKNHTGSPGFNVCSFFLSVVKHSVFT